MHITNTLNVIFIAGVGLSATSRLGFDISLNIQREARNVTERQTLKEEKDLTKERDGELLDTYDSSNAQVVGGKSLKDLSRITDKITILGVLSQAVEMHTDLESKGQRRWWVVKFQKGFSLLIKMWNGEIDVKKNQRFFQVGTHKTVLDGLSDDVKYNLENARFRIDIHSLPVLQAATEANQHLSLTFKMSSADPPRHGSCWRSAAKTMKRAVKGWFGLYSQKNLELQELNAENASDHDGGVVVKGLKGAELLNVVLLMYSLLRDLEKLYSQRLLGAPAGDITEEQEAIADKFEFVSEVQVEKVPDAQLQGKLRGILNDWRDSISQEGEQQAILNEIRNMPSEGVAVELTSFGVVRVKGVTMKGFAEDGSLLFEVIVEERDSRQHVKLDQHEWKSKVIGYVNAEQQFGILPGSQGIRYGEAFHLLEQPVASGESPIEKSLWANAQKDSENDKAEYGCRVLVKPLCEGHPAVDEIFKVKNRPGSYKVISVEVVHERKKVAKLNAVQVDIETTANRTSSIFTFWEKKILTSKKVILDIQGEQLQVTGVDKQHLITTKVKQAIGSLDIGIIEAKDKAHIAVIAHRISELLLLAVTEVWTPSYLNDDHDKKIRRRIEIAAKVVTGLLVAGLAATGIGMAVVGIPVLFGAGVAAAWTTISGTMFFFLYTNVFLNLMNLTPSGLPNMIYQYVNRKYLASIMVRSNLDYAEKLGASSTALIFCPAGSHADADSQDPRSARAMCSRQKLRLRNKEEREGALKALQEKSGDKLMDPWYSKMFKKIKFWESPSPEEEQQRSVELSMYLMTELAQTLAAVSDMECEAVADPSLDQHYRLRERWTLMDRPGDVTYKAKSSKWNKINKAM